MLARWQLGDGSELRLELNLGDVDLEVAPPSAGARLLHASRDTDAESGMDMLPARTAKMYLEVANER